MPGGDRRRRFAGPIVVRRDDAEPIGRGSELPGLDIAVRSRCGGTRLPNVKACFDPPKTLADLQAAALDPQPGYDVHHVVEGATSKDAAETALVDSLDNQVLIPTLKHWELNAWYGKQNFNYGGMCPRDYVRDKSWEERKSVGLTGLRTIGVLK